MSFEPGTVVVVHDHQYDEKDCVGIVRERRASKSHWSHVGNGYVPVEIIHGGRIRGGYREASLSPLYNLKEKS